jgi:hypothetical protein
LTGKSYERHELKRPDVGETLMSGLEGAKFLMKLVGGCVEMESRAREM